MTDAMQEAEELVRSLRVDANALNVALFDRDGNVLASDLDGDFDVQAIGPDLAEAPEREFDLIDEETGESRHVRIEPFAGGRFILFVMYDDHSTVGLVRISIKKTREKFETVLGQLA